LTLAFSTTIAVKVSVPICPTTSVPSGHQSCLTRSSPRHSVDTFDSRVRFRSYSPRELAMAGAGIGATGGGSTTATVTVAGGASA